MNNKKANSARIIKIGFELTNVHKLHYCQNSKSGQWFKNSTNHKKKDEYVKGLLYSYNNCIF